MDKSVNFTREPIIETIISPKDGYKLCIKSSKGGSGEEYFVDAIEVVSFGQSMFYRSLERPKPFLVPVMDYEVTEVKEARVVLKNVAPERNIKIGGGRDASLRASKEPSMEKTEDVAEESASEGASEEAMPEISVEQRGSKKRDRRRNRRRRPDDRRDWNEREKGAAPSEDTSEEKESEDGEMAEEGKISTPLFSTLFPPPPTLISDTISRYKDHMITPPTPPTPDEPSHEKSFSKEEETAAPKQATEDFVALPDEEDFPMPSSFTHTKEEGHQE